MSSYTSNKSYYYISMGKKKSGVKPRGQQDCFEVKDIIFPNISPVVDLATNETHTEVNYPLFHIYDPENDLPIGVDAKRVAELKDHLNQSKQEPDKIVLTRIVHQSKDGKIDGASYEVAEVIELDQAVAFSTNASHFYQVQSDKAQYGHGAEGKTKEAIDYKLKTVNQK